MALRILILLVVVDLLMACSVKKAISNNGALPQKNMGAYSFISWGNPIVRHIYTADPAVRVFNDTLFVYTSHDQDTATGFNMEDWRVFSTTDMINWTDHGAVLSLNEIPWADRYAWAPDCIKRNGKYFFYFPVEQKHIGVAVSDHPYGPFEDALGQPTHQFQFPWGGCQSGFYRSGHLHRR